MVELAALFCNSCVRRLGRITVRATLNRTKRVTTTHTREPVAGARALWSVSVAIVARERSLVYEKDFKKTAVGGILHPAHHYKIIVLCFFTSRLELSDTVPRHSFVVLHVLKFRWISVAHLDFIQVNIICK